MNACDRIRSSMKRDELDQIERIKAESRYVKTRNIGRPPWVVGMTVAYRERPTVRQTLDSLLAAGFPEPLLFCEPESNDVPSDASVLRNSEKLGNWGNFRNRAKHLASMSTHSETRFLLVQDDVDFLPDTCRWVEQNWPANNGVCSLYRSSRYKVQNPKDSWSILNYGKPFLGALAIVLTKGLLFSLVDNLDAMHDADNKNDDLKFGQFCHALRIPVNIATSSKCQHTGYTSSIYSTKQMSKTRRADTYVG